MLALGASLSCGDSATDPTAPSPAPPPPPPPPIPSTVTVVPSAALLAALGDTVRLTAEVRDQNGRAMPGTSVAWASSDAAVAAVDASGLATAAGNGTATITATSGSASGTATVTVEQSVAAVTITPDSAVVLVGDTLRLSATMVDALGAAVEGAAVVWSSADTLVATVDSSGLATGVASGALEITATSSGVDGRARLVVADAAPTTVRVSPDSVSLMALGDTIRLSAEVFDQIGRAMPGAAVAWSSVDPAVASVDSTGLVRAEGAGTAMVTAASGSASGSASVSVMPLTSSVRVTPAEATIGPGDTLRLSAQAFDDNGHAVAGVEFSWSSSDESVATVAGSGLVRGVAEGVTVITATAGDLDGTSEITVAHPDRTALVALYDATDGPNWTKSDNWLTDAPLGEWYGVSASHEGRVNGLVLLSNELSGEIPPELGNLTRLGQLVLAGNDLTGEIPPELGHLTHLWDVTLFENRLTGAIPPALGKLTRLEFLQLNRNELSGEIPSELSNLTRLERLDVGGNDLTGAIPSELGNLTRLEWLEFAGNDLTGPIPPELGNLTRLERLQFAGNDLAGPIPSELGNLTRVTVLALNHNRLTGRVPSEFGNLDSLEYLYVDNNPDLYGELPRTLLALSELKRVYLDDTDLCAPADQVFQDWLNGLEEWRGEICEGGEVGHREILMALHEAAGGANWTDVKNWGSDHPLNEWYGVTADTAGRVTELDLSGNHLTGTLSAEVGGLETLVRLRVGGNPGLGGHLPLSLVRLLALDEFDIGGTGLCLPPNARVLDWLAGVSRFRGEHCSDDHGNSRESASEAPADGTVSGELNYFEDEDLFSVRIPLEGILSVRTSGDTETRLELYDGADRFGVGGDGAGGISRRLPPGGYFIHVSGVNRTTTGAYTLELSFEPLAPPARAYLTQAVQSHDGVVPLVAGEDALLRVFVIAPGGAGATMPPVRATFHRAGTVVRVVDISAGAARVPQEMREDDLGLTANAVIPGDVLAPGLEMVVEIDPDGTLDPSLGIGGRIPEEGRLAIDVRRVPEFHVTAVPLLNAQNPDSSGFKATVGLTAEHEVFYETRDWLPVADMEVVVREPLLVDYDPEEDMSRALDDIAFLRVAEGASGYYMGVPPWRDGGVLGIAYSGGGKSTVSRLDGHTVAHEFGHGFSLAHAPCGGPALVDPHYPHAGGLIGGWGYDATLGNLVNPERHTDLMTYCREDDWISDYSFSKAFDYRIETAASPMMASRSRAADRVLVVRGGRRDGRLRLHPAFVLDAPPALPEGPGSYRLTGTDAAGRELFHHRFALSEIADFEAGAASFVFALPAPDSWAGALDRITLTGPEGTAELGRDGAVAERLVLDADTGRIRAILRGEEALADAPSVVQPGRGRTATLVSRGIPGAEWWWR